MCAMAFNEDEERTFTRLFERVIAFKRSPLSLECA